MKIAMNEFIKRLESEKIFAHDRAQLELKSEFIPSEKEEDQLFAQELYVFTPNSLDINPLTYSKTDFYQDRVNFIRYKTPVFSIEELLNVQNLSSPLCRTEKLIAETPIEKDKLVDELKLLANVFSSALREQVRALYHDWKDLGKKVFSYSVSIEKQSKELFSRLKALLTELETDPSLHFCKKTLLYSEEYMRNSLIFFLTGLLDQVQVEKLAKNLEAKKVLQNLCLVQKNALQELRVEPEDLQKGSNEQEYFLYRQGLLNKFVFSSLFLSLQEKKYDTHLQNIVGSIAAACGMSVFLILLVLPGNVFGVDSQIFILATVVVYVIRELLKDAIKTVSLRKASRFFPDQTTIISSPKTQHPMGRMTEGYVHLPLNSLPHEISKIRNEQFHDVMEDIERPETVFHYKKTLLLHNLNANQGRRNCLNIIFRYNIEKLLHKADDPFHRYLTLNEKSHLQSVILPKVYHINIIMKNTTYIKKKEVKSEYKKFRLIVNKQGICRIEQIRD